MRARNIKPGFFENELLAEMPHWVRLLFIGLWCMADRAGRLKNRPRRMKRELFPDEDVDIPYGLGLLIKAGFLDPYTVGGLELLHVTGWDDNQNPHHREAESVLPPPPAKRAARARVMDQPSTNDAPPEQVAPCPTDSGFLIPDSLIPDPVGPALPDWLPVEDWTRWHDYRSRRNKSAWTAEAQRLSVLKLGKLRDAGDNVTAVIDQSIECGWTGLFALKGGAGNGKAKPGVAGRIVARANARRGR